MAFNLPTGRWICDECNCFWYEDAMPDELMRCPSCNGIEVHKLKKGEKV